MPWEEPFQSSAMDVIKGSTESKSSVFMTVGDFLRSNSELKSQQRIKSEGTIISARSGDDSEDTFSNATYFEIELDHPFEQSPVFGLSFFPSSMFATIMEDAIISLHILEECNSAIRIHKALNDMPDLLNKKYGIQELPEPADKYDMKTGSQLECMEFKLNKLEGDRNESFNVLYSTYRSLVLQRSFRTLYDYVMYKDYQREYGPQLEEQHAKHKIHARMMMKQLRQQRNNNKRLLYDMESVCFDLKQKIEDADQTAEIRSRYVTRWQSARTEQHQEVIQLKEHEMVSAIDKHKTLMDQEARAHNEIETLVSISISESMAEVERWMEKYEDDMEEMDLRIQIKNNDYENMLDRRREMERTISRHNQEMQEWIKFKEERAKAEKYAKTMTESAIVVQAWWRGILVRLQLGPYRPKKKGARGGKKK